MRRVIALTLFGVIIAACGESASVESAKTGAGSTTSSSAEAEDDDRASGSPNFSNGCENVAVEPGARYLSLEHGGWDRDYLMTVPDTASRDSKAYPLLIAMHGYGGNGAGMRSMLQETSGFEDSYVVLYPDGAGDKYSPRGWNSGHPKCCGPALENNVDDVGFIRHLVNMVATEACIDLDRVYATGFSNGGDMAERLACDASDVVAAVTSVAGRFDYHASACPGNWPVPTVLYRNKLDRVVPYESDMLSSVALRTVPALEGFERIANNHQCKATLITEEVTEDTSCRRFADCAAGFEITMCTTSDAGHCWPGIGGCSGGGEGEFLASDHMLEFFSRH